jgi:hypothetical protein
LDRRSFSSSRDVPAMLVFAEFAAIPARLTWFSEFSTKATGGRDLKNY